MDARLTHVAETCLHAVQAAIFRGRRAVYFGRTAEMHIEHIPQ